MINNDTIAWLECIFQQILVIIMLILLHHRNTSKVIFIRNNNSFCVLIQYFDFFIFIQKNQHLNTKCDFYSPIFTILADYDYEFIQKF